MSASADAQFNLTSCNRRVWVEIFWSWWKSVSHVVVVLPGTKGRLDRILAFQSIQFLEASGGSTCYLMLQDVTRCYKYLISLSLKSFSLSARHSKTILLILLPGHRFVLRTNLVATANATANATAKMAVTRWLDDLTVVTVRSGLRPVLRLLSRFNGDDPQFISLSQFISVSVALQQSAITAEDNFVKVKTSGPITQSTSSLSSPATLPCTRSAFCDLEIQI